MIKSEGRGGPPVRERESKAYGSGCHGGERKTRGND